MRGCHQMPRCGHEAGGPNFQDVPRRTQDARKIRNRNRAAAYPGGCQTRRRASQVNHVSQSSLKAHADECPLCSCATYCVRGVKYGSVTFLTKKLTTIHRELSRQFTSKSKSKSKSKHSLLLGVVNDEWREALQRQHPLISPTKHGLFSHDKNGV